jgi:chemotaxis regulatin CheY-phosphate phosphatase CheZ
MSPEQAAAVARIREGAEQAAMCQPALPAILVSTADAVAILAALDAAQAERDALRERVAAMEAEWDAYGKARAAVARRAERERLRGYFRDALADTGITWPGEVDILYDKCFGAPYVPDKAA